MASSRLKTTGRTQLEKIEGGARDINTTHAFELMAVSLIAGYGKLKVSEQRSGEGGKGNRQKQGEGSVWCRGGERTKTELGYRAERQRAGDPSAR